MRIVAGKYRGKKLKEFELDSTRPTLDRVKESIFNLIQFDVADAVVLDLFAGTGALGIEAISRGAGYTTLVDCNKEAIKIIRENLKGIEGNFAVENLDYKQFLNSTNQKFDIVLLDPPYKTNYGIDAIKILNERNLLTNNAIIIFETSEEKDVDFNLTNFKISKKRYGTVVVYKLEKIN
jgi:16S rRNA (guanine966-N2)-methyltransferase